MPDLTALRHAKIEAIRVGEELRLVLQPFYDNFPDFFPKPLDQMGLSDKVKMADLFLKFISTFVGDTCQED